jgi:hypothetical protein
MDVVHRKVLVAIGALLAVALGGPANSWAQCSHGASIFKTCISPKPSCGSDADCPDTPCSDGVCDSPGGAFVDCSITLGHADTCGDTTKITEGFDIDDFGGDNVRAPAVGNLPISGTFGNAVCCPGPTLPCFVGPAGGLGSFASGSCGTLNLPGAGAAGSVTFHNTQYNIQPSDPDPLPNQGNVKVQDQCNITPLGCSSGVSTVQFTASTDLLDNGGCSSASKPLSTPCEADGNLCTTDHCDGQGACVLLSNVTCQAPAPPCEGGSVCNPGTGACDPQPDAPISTPCNNDNNLCTVDHCNGSGTCVFQSNVTCAAPNPPCEGGEICNPNTGGCVPQPDAPISTPCDADSNVCTTDHCDGNGMCVFVSTNPDPSCDNNHYKCYKVTNEPFTQRAVTLEDQFGSSTATVIKATRFCNPADKNSGGIVDPTAHLMCYTIRESGFTKRTVVVRNQFGDQTVTVLKPETLCNPAEKNGVPFGSADGAFLDHFKCYRIRGKGFTKRDVTLTDQFETRTDTVLKPKLLCNPVNKNNEGIPNSALHLTCYTLKAAPFTPQPITVEDQFGEQSGQPFAGECSKRAHICVPTIKNPT